MAEINTGAVSEPVGEKKNPYIVYDTEADRLAAKRSRQAFAELLRIKGLDPNLASEKIGTPQSVTLEDIANGEVQPQEKQSENYSLSQWVDLPLEKRQQLVAHAKAQKPSNMSDEVYKGWMGEVQKVEEVRATHDFQNAKEQSAIDRYGAYFSSVMGKSTEPQIEALQHKEAGSSTEPSEQLIPELAVSQSEPMQQETVTTQIEEVSPPAPSLTVPGE